MAFQQYNLYITMPYLNRVNGMSSNKSHCRGIKMLQFMKHAKEVIMNDKGVQRC